ncbi:hypothetical protein [Methylobacillus arboreus]|uniref:hypothetical protein n=1 Tax=Methylobacillus arboreus TaxID=755170 RepID=UPI001E637B67|nr:hypothetical protein [Methylobacillus arboreus]
MNYGNLVARLKGAFKFAPFNTDNFTGQTSVDSGSEFVQVFDKTKIYTRDAYRSPLKAIGIPGNFIESATSGTVVATPTPAPQLPLPKFKGKPAKKVDILVGVPFYMDEVQANWLIKGAANVWSDDSWNFESTDGLATLRNYDIDSSFSRGTNVLLNNDRNLVYTANPPMGQNWVPAGHAPNPAGDNEYWLKKPALSYDPERHRNTGHGHGDSKFMLAKTLKDLADVGVDYIRVQQRTNPPLLADGERWEVPETNYSYFTTVILNDLPSDLVGPNGIQPVFWIQSTGYTASRGGWNKDSSYTTAETSIDNTTNHRLYRVRGGQAVSPNEPSPSNNPTKWELVPMPPEWVNLASVYANSLYRNKVMSFMHTPAANFSDRTPRRLALVYAHEGGQLGGTDTIGFNTFRFWLREFSAKLVVDSGGFFEGVAFLARNSIAPTVADGVTYSNGCISYDDDWNAARILLLRGDYEGWGASFAETQKPRLERSMQGLYDNFGTFNGNMANGQSRRVYVVPASLVSVAPHPSGFYYPGHSPELFSKFIARAIVRIQAGNGYPILDLANAGELAEMGAGMYVNNLNFYAYLDAAAENLLE